MSNKTNTIILYLSSLLSVLVGVGTSVVNTRSLSIEEYGDVRYINNFLSFFASLFLFGFFVSGARLLAITPDIQVRRRINGAMVLVLCVASLITMLCIVICYYTHSLWSEGNVSVLFLYSLPICFAPLLLNYVNNTFQGENRIINLSIARCLPGILYLIIAVVLYQYIAVTSAWMILLQNGLVLLVLLGNIIYTRPLFRQIKETIHQLMEENKRYGLHVYVGSLFAVSFGYLAGISLGVFGENNIQVGFFMLASTISSPLAILPAITGTSYFKQFANEQRISNRLFLFTVCISLLSLLAFVALVYPMVIFLYDHSYLDVAWIAAFLAVATTIHGFGDMLNRFLGAHGRGKDLRNGAFACGFILLLGNVVFVYYWGINGAIATRILSSSAYLLAMSWYYRNYTKEKIGL